jgi:lipopolysaccharide export system protein LptA
MTQPGFGPRRVLASFTCAAALGWAASAGAEQADRNKPIHFSAEQPAEVDFDKRVGTLRGNVVITQGTLTIHADRIDFKQNADNSLSATAYGNPIDFREKKDGSDEYYEGYAQRAVYNGQTHTLELFDNALLKEGNNEFRGNYISYNSDTNFMKAEGRPNAPGGQGPGPRVQGVFEPRSDNPLGTKSAPKSDGKGSDAGRGAAKPDAKGDAAKSAPKPDGKGSDAAKNARAKAAPLTLTPDSTLSAK